MTRKRFIKLLMAQGEQRNDAQELASFYSRCNISYVRAHIICKLRVQAFQQNEKGV